MGRFDSLTQLETKPVQPPPLPEKPANQQITKEAKKQTSLPTNQLTSKEVNQRGSKPVNTQTSKPANQQTSKSLKKFGSYLTEESIRGLKRIAFDTDRKDYEVLQEAVNLYLQKNK